MSRHDSPSITKAKSILRGQDEAPQDLMDLSRQLKKEKAFGYARRLLARGRQKPEVKGDPKWRLEFAQQHALCTYKDPDLPTADRLESALGILEGVEDLLGTKNQETLGLVGAIHKRKWELDGQKQHLERALAFYHRGFQLGPASDYGYTGINAAFVLDLLASIEIREAKEAGLASPTAGNRTDEAVQIREDLVSKLLPLLDEADKNWLATEWWFLVTLAEAFFGLELYDKSLEWLTKAAALPDIPVWEYESTTRQLATLARLHAERSGSRALFEETKAWEVLSNFLGKHAAGVRTAFAGKVGLALSGGGFRASLFHIGVLAKLAELDMLRHVEVLSCVSGGSILGAHYYLETRKLLQEKPDDQVNREDYIEIVQRLEKDFLAGVQRNVRTRVAASFLTNVKMIFSKNYSRTERVGELYEKQIYSRIDDGEGGKPRWLNEAFVNPKGEEANFAPKHDNWRRRAKVPILILNATSLNTGHNWQFTGSWMGEPPGAVNTDVDGNERLRRMYYDQAPPAHRRVRLGYAVAASACVPGLFEPLILKGLYPDRTVRLVDGGVHDNQGVASLLEQDCGVMLVSDAAGQMNSEKDPSSGVLGVPLRSNSILMARVREAEYEELHARRQSSLLRGLMFVHLKKDLEVEPVDWINCEDPREDSTQPRPGRLTYYGILKSIQHRLAAIRTDLDSFSDAEAFALMTSGYRMTEHEFLRSINGFTTPAEDPSPWRFLTIEGPMKEVSGREAAHHDLDNLLDVGANSAFKIWKLSRPLQVAGILLAIAAVVGAGWWCWTNWSEPLITVGTIGSMIGLAVVCVIVGKTILRIARFRETLFRIGLGLGMALLGWLIAGIHLHFFDKWFLRRGRVQPSPKVANNR